MIPLRLDRYLTLYFFYPFLRILPKKNEERIPILMYHSISNEKMKNVHPYYETNTIPKIFSDHMKFLFENDYTVIGLNDAINILNSQNIYGENILCNQIINQSTNKRVKYAVITFDDGFRDFYTKAFPILQKYGYSATVFLPTAYIRDEGVWFKKKKCMSWNEIRELHRYGIGFGSHTVNHPVLYEIQKAEIDGELKCSKKIIEDEISESITLFSYPYAFPGHDYNFVRMLRGLLIKNGYEVGVTTQIGKISIKDDTFFMKRLPVNSFDDNNFFRAKLEGAYDWIYFIQKVFKNLKSLFKKQSICKQINSNG